MQAFDASLDSTTERTESMKNHKCIWKNILTLAMLALSIFHASAQGWEQTFSLTDNEDLGHLVTRADGGYTAITYEPHNFFPGPTAEMVATDAFGNEEWINTFSEIIAGQVLIQAPNEDYIIIGGEVVDFAVNSRLGIVRTDAVGDPIWEQMYLINGDYVDQWPTAGLLLSNGDLLIAGQLQGGNIDTRTFLMKTDDDGNELWTQQYIPDEYIDQINCISIAANGEFLLTGYRTWTATPAEPQFLLMRVDTEGNIISTNTWNVIGAQPQSAQLSDGNLLYAANDSVGLPELQLLLNKTDQDGNLIWEQIITAPEMGLLNGTYNFSRGLSGTDDGGAILICKTQFRSSILKLNSVGEVEWFQTFGVNGDNLVRLNDVAQSPDGSYIATGEIDQLNVHHAFMVHLDENGVLYDNIISGKVYDDANENCDYDPSESDAPGWVIKIEGTDFDRFALTDSDGNYSAEVPPSTFNVRVVSHPYYSICPGSSQVIFSNSGETATVDFGLQDTVLCPLLEVSMQGMMRRCFTNTYHGQVCNMGTVAAEDAYVEVLLDPWLTYLSSDPPNPTQNGQLLTFNFGDIEVGECLTFQIQFELDCDAPMGITHCTEVHAYPDTLCIPTDPNWDESSVQVSGECVGDEMIRFILLNGGTGDMQQESQYIVIEDHMIMLQEPFQLNMGDDMTSEWTATGGTFRLEADQCPGHPGSSFPSVTVEGCGLGQGLVISTGIYTQYPQDDANPWIDIVCLENTAAYDPNDKSAEPRGVLDDHFIEPDTDLEYLIRFQNTGTDTAFNVVIRDTLSSLLDPSSVRPGASSHPYYFDLSGQGLLEFTFPNIMLPDSNVNEPLSHGFVKFSIAQQPDVELGSVIENSAAIYFDFNEPIITNATWHTVDTAFLVMTSVDPGLGGMLPQVSVYPNPMMEAAFFEVEGVENEEITLTIFDQTGRQVHSTKSNSMPLKLHRGTLPAGLYLFEMRTKRGLLGSGKITVIR